MPLIALKQSSLPVTQPVSQQSSWSWGNIAKTAAIATVAVGVAAAAAYYFSSSSAASSAASAVSTSQPPSSLSAAELIELPSNVCVNPDVVQKAATEQIDLCKGSLSAICAGNYGIPRKLMPQLTNATVIQSYLDFKSSQGIKVTEELVEAASLHPVQNELNGEKIFGMMKSAAAHTYDPCKDTTLIANDYVIDGHHRWSACALMQQAMKVFRVHQDANTVLADLQHFPGVEHFDLIPPPGK